MNRTSIKALRILVNELNKLTGMPLEYSTKDKNGKLKSNVGHYHISQAYGGYRLDQVVNDAGAIEVVSRDGYGTKRQLESFLRAFINGIQVGKNEN